MLAACHLNLRDSFTLEGVTQISCAHLNVHVLSMLHGVAEQHLLESRYLSPDVTPAANFAPEFHIQQVTVTPVSNSERAHV